MKKRIPLIIPNPYYHNPDAVKPLVQIVQTDVCVYGGNSAGVVAAVQISRKCALPHEMTVPEQARRLYAV